MDDSKADARKRAFDRKRQREIRAAAKARGRKQALFELPCEQLAYLDQLKSDFGVKSRSDVLERLIAALATQGTPLAMNQENGVSG